MNKRIFLSYEEAHKLIKPHKLKSSREWFEFYKNNKPNIPYFPSKYYKEWNSWASFLDNDNIATYKKEYISYEKSSEFVKKLKIKSYEEWLLYYDNNDIKNIPKNPHNTYKDK